jgi:hypothetical protein
MASEQTMIFKIQCTIHRMQGFFAPLREKISGQRSSEVILVESLTNRLCTKVQKIPRACPVEFHVAAKQNKTKVFGCHGLAPWSLTFAAI